MIISVNWLKKFVDINSSIDELATLIGARLVEIESVENIGEKYKDVIVAKVIECAPLEGSDHLNVAKIDDGGVVRGIERDENGLVQVVCGAPNVRAGILVAWLPPQSIVPETFSSDAPFVLSTKPLRGVMSNGMLASARELDLYDDHDGILEVDKNAEPGASFAALYELDDYLLDIENKSLTHRPDTFGVIGFAREIAGIQGLPFTTPEWLTQLEPGIDSTSELAAPNVVIEDEGLSARFMAVVLSGVNEAASSPIQLQTYLARSGVRPVNAAVDVTNYLMLLTGQPAHTYDYDKLKALAGDDVTIRVRSAREGEKLTLLDGKEISLDSSDIVIAAGDTAVGLAGIMGGQSTAVDASTKIVLLEVATFDLYRMRSSQMRHGIFSEAVTRFTKGIPAPLAAPVLAEATTLLRQYAGAQVASQVAEAYPGKASPTIVTVNESRINDVLGTAFAAEDITELLNNVGFSVTFDGLEAQVTVPYWRQDIHIAEDVIEEIGRLYGYDTINQSVPRRDFEAVEPSHFDVLRTQLKQRLVRAGANEVLTYSFVHGDLLKKAGQTPSNAYRIVNSISPDLQYYRQSLTPSLLSHIFANVKAGYSSFALFEANKVHRKSDGVTSEDVPIEKDSIALVIADAKASGAAYYDAKNMLEYVVATSGRELQYAALSEDTADPLYAPFEPKRSAVVVDKTTGVILGVVGELKKSVQKAFKLPEYTAAFEIDPRALLESSLGGVSNYQPLSRFPGVERDICFQVASSVPYAHVSEAAHSVLSTSGLITTIEPLDIYQAEASETKNITIRIRYTSYEKTMTNEDAAAVLADVTVAVIEATDGKVI